MSGRSKPKIIYFPIQGRAEPIRLALAAAGVEWEFEEVDKRVLKSDLDHYPFGQVPRYIDDEVDMVQSMGILRHVGRKYGLYGASLAEQARVEEVIEGVNDLIVKLFVDCVIKLKDSDDPEALKDAFWQQRLDPASTTAPITFGAHAAFLSRLLGKSGSGYFVESGLTVADICMTVGMQLLLGVFAKERMAQQWPDLVALHDRVLALPRIAAYMEGPLYIPTLHPLTPGPAKPESDQA